MDEFKNLKSIIDEQLEDIKVTNKLKKNTMNHIFHKENSFLMYVKRNWMKMTTVFSMFVVIFALGIHMFYQSDDPEITPDNYPLSESRCPQDNSQTESYFDQNEDEVSTTSDSCEVNP